MKKFVAFVAFIACGYSASAQFYDKMFFLGWNINTPLVNKTYAGKSTTKGARLGYRELINEHVAVGVDITWATYDDYVPTQTYYRKNSTLTTDFTNYANNYGVLLTGDYYFYTDNKIMPYAGFGAGLAYNSYKRYYNVYSDGENAFGLLMRPQAGVWLKFNERKNWAFNAGVHLDFSTAKSKNQDIGYKNFVNAGFELGFVFLDW